MENASKALLIAAGVFIAIILVSMLVVLYNQISTHYNQKHEMSVIEQTQKFNEKFESYHRNNVRGSDLISLMNRVIDYNSSESYQDGTNYERIRVRIILGNQEILKQFRCETDDETYLNIFFPTNGIITNIKSTGNDWDNDKAMTNITNTSAVACQMARSIYGIYNMTDTKLQKLASKTQNIFVDENDNSKMAIYKRVYRAEMLGEILGDNVVQVDKIYGKAIGSSPKRLEGIKQVTSDYYQYMQFKRAYFDCIEVKYDEQTNRVVEMNFKLQVKDGKVVFD